MKSKQSSPVSLASVDAIYRPKSVAVIGASDRSGKWGNLIVGHILEGGFGGQLYLVNANGSSVFGRPSFRSVTEIPEAFDLAIVGVSSGAVPKVVDECASAGCKAVVVVTSGFRDRDAVGRRVEERMVVGAKEKGLRLVGPNCMGVYSAAGALYASIALEQGAPGGVALVSQSGTIGISLFRDGARSGLRFHSFLGLGNQADLDFTDFINYLAADAACSSVLLYVEGVKNSDAFFDAVQRCSECKPVIALKGGHGESGARAAKSHTGALAKDGRVFEALFRQAGGITVSTLDELVNTAIVLNEVPKQRSHRIAILTDGGSFGVLAADRSEREGLQLTRLERKTKERLTELLPDYCTIGNPTDVGGAADVDPAIIGRVGVELLSDKNVDALLVSGLIGGYTDSFNVPLESAEARGADDMIEKAQQVNKPLVIHSMWTLGESSVLRQFVARGIPVVGSLDDALTALAQLDSYVQWRQHVHVGPREGQRFLRTSRAALGDADGYDESQVYELLASFGLTIPPFRVARDQTTALQAAREIGYPIVLKALSPGVLHKSEAGGVRLGIATDEELASNFADLHSNFEELLIVKHVLGVCEFMVGGLRTDSFGPVLTIGLGGLLAEAIDEVVFAQIPSSSGEIRRALDGSKVIQRVLQSRRRGRGLAAKELYRVAETVARIMLSIPKIKSLEINPVILDESNAWIADAKLKMVSP